LFTSLQLVFNGSTPWLEDIALLTTLTRMVDLRMDGYPLFRSQAVLVLTAFPHLTCLVARNLEVDDTLLGHLLDMTCLQVLALAGFSKRRVLERDVVGNIHAEQVQRERNQDRVADADLDEAFYFYPMSRLPLRVLDIGMSPCTDSWPSTLAALSQTLTSLRLTLYNPAEDDDEPTDDDHDGSSQEESLDGEEGSDTAHTGADSSSDSHGTDSNGEPSDTVIPAVQLDTIISLATMPPAALGNLRRLVLNSDDYAFRVEDIVRRCTSLTHLFLMGSTEVLNMDPMADLGGWNMLGGPITSSLRELLLVGLDDWLPLQFFSEVSRLHNLRRLAVVDCFTKDPHALDPGGMEGLSRLSELELSPMHPVWATSGRFRANIYSYEYGKLYTLLDRMPPQLQVVRIWCRWNSDWTEVQNIFAGTPNLLVLKERRIVRCKVEPAADAAIRNADYAMACAHGLPV
jgi:hypothetical protein